MNKIGADGDLTQFERPDLLAQLVLAYREPLLEPWLDVGAGESWLRNELRKIALCDLWTDTVDLDVERYAFGDSCFRTITSFEVIEHLYNPLFNFLELKRVLHPDGRIFLSTPNDESLLCKILHLFGWKYRPHFHQFTERDLRDLAGRAGLEVRSVKKVNGVPSRIPFMKRLSRSTLFCVLSHGSPDSR